MTTETWAVIGCDDRGVTVEKRGTDPAALAAAAASWAQQEQDKWPSFGLIYMLVTGEEADAADHVDDVPAGPWEPGEVDLTQLARYVIMLHADPHLRLTTGHAVLGAWVELTGAPDDQTALTYARRLSDAADTDGTRVTAHVAPF